MWLFVPVAIPDVRGGADGDPGGLGLIFEHLEVAVHAEVLDEDAEEEEEEGVGEAAIDGVLLGVVGSASSQVVLSGPGDGGLVEPGPSLVAFSGPVDDEGVDSPQMEAYVEIRAVVPLGLVSLASFEGHGVACGGWHASGPEVAQYHEHADDPIDDYLGGDAEGYHVGDPVGDPVECVGDNLEVCPEGDVEDNLEVYPVGGVEDNLEACPVGGVEEGVERCSVGDFVDDVADRGNLAQDQIDYESGGRNHQNP
ncbi:uncharacterized protein GIQ15_02711 [Arthroderma uncinatum]|uniref:uncharacterized protein n=1 Tax=Arthroderma uncinatum TaxID=74035 RepID=UPI00144A8240|nr:uncharacterized protein GIQ15_02711 [Arthroderma uncinatum]KAF3483387.1 hypothetical protein GIQ15_02711 [Arthroderma uncinatum]